MSVFLIPPTITSPLMDPQSGKGSLVFALLLVFSSKVHCSHDIGVAPVSCQQMYSNTVLSFDVSTVRADRNISRTIFHLFRFCAKAADATVFSVHFSSS